MLSYAIAAASQEGRPGKPLAQGDSPQVLPIVGSSAQYYNQLGERWLETAAAVVLHSQRGLATRLQDYQEALGSFRKAGNLQRVAFCLQKLGDLHAAQGHLALSQAELQEALQIYQAMRYPAVQGIYDLLGMNEADQGHFDKAARLSGYYIVHGRPFCCKVRL